MAHMLRIRPPTRTPGDAHHRRNSSSSLSESALHRLRKSPQFSEANNILTNLQNKLKCRCRFSCLFNGNNKQEQARKALENALDGKITDYEKWDKEIKRREEANGGGNSGGGGWFRWPGGSDGDDFWKEAPQAFLTALVLVAMYLVAVKCDMMLAVVLSPLLFTFRGARDGVTSVSSQVMKGVNVIQTTPEANSVTSKYEEPSQASAKDSVVSKWGSD
ncbi:unnamed protein product [Cuscuta epithymum]|uniref:Uncharacterized protein n=1 Tax=Cuscuta epithymum TaxID=186058 RepID=A0AAV0F5H4_9ASTE|nr:unnamed protein product [Cuscuta epithymum]